MNGFFSPNCFDLEKFSKLAVLASKHGLSLDFCVNDEEIVTELSISYRYYDEVVALCTGNNVYDCLVRLRRAIKNYPDYFGNS